MGRAKRTSAKFDQENLDILTEFVNRNEKTTWKDITNDKSKLGILSQQIFGKNSSTLRRKIYGKIKSIQQEKQVFLFSGKTSRLGRTYKPPFWLKHKSYEFYTRKQTSHDLQSEIPDLQDQTLKEKHDERDYDISTDEQDYNISTDEQDYDISTDEQDYDISTDDEDLVCDKNKNEFSKDEMVDEEVQEDCELKTDYLHESHDTKPDIVETNLKQELPDLKMKKGHDRQDHDISTDEEDYVCDKNKNEFSNDEMVDEEEQEDCELKTDYLHESHATKPDIMETNLKQELPDLKLKKGHERQYHDISTDEEDLVCDKNKNEFSNDEMVDEEVQEDCELKTDYLHESHATKPHIMETNLKQELPDLKLKKGHERQYHDISTDEEDLVCDKNKNEFSNEDMVDEEVQEDCELKTDYLHESHATKPDIMETNLKQELPDLKLKEEYDDQDSDISTDEEDLVCDKKRNVFSYEEIVDEEVQEDCQLKTDYLHERHATKPVIMETNLNQELPDLKLKDEHDGQYYDISTDEEDLVCDKKRNVFSYEEIVDEEVQEDCQLKTDYLHERHATISDIMERNLNQELPDLKLKEEYDGQYYDISTDEEDLVCDKKRNVFSYEEIVDEEVQEDLQLKSEYLHERHATFAKPDIMETNLNQELPDLKLKEEYDGQYHDISTDEEDLVCDKKKNVFSHEEIVDEEVQEDCQLKTDYLHERHATKPDIMERNLNQELPDLKLKEEYDGQYYDISTDEEDLVCDKKKNVFSYEEIVDEEEQEDHQIKTDYLHERHATKPDIMERNLNRELPDLKLKEEYDDQDSDISTDEEDLVCDKKKSEYSNDEMVNEEIQEDCELKTDCLDDRKEKERVFHKVHMNDGQVIKDGFVFKINYIDEWKSIKPDKKNRKRTKKVLKKGWTNLFSKKFNSVIPGCVLSFKGHDISAGKKGPYVNAIAICKHDNCGRFRFKMMKKPNRSQNEIEVNVDILNAYTTHSRKTIKKRQLKGNERKEIQKKLQKEAASTVFYERVAEMNENEFDEGNYSYPQSKTVLRKAKSEWNVYDVLHNDPYTELCIIASMLDDQILGNHINGYVQSILYKPFATVLFTEKSLQAAKENIRVNNGVFYLDATGTVVHKIDAKDKKLLYYAMVQPSSGGLQDASFPVLEFILSKQTTLHITNALMHFFDALRKFSKFSNPSRIETDFSWAMIHGVLAAVNVTTIDKYLQYTFRLLSGKQEQEKSITVIHLCAAHMLKAIKQNLKDKINDKGLREFAIRTFALMQNCTALKQLIDIWRTMCVVFGKRYLSEKDNEQVDNLRFMVRSASLDGLECILVCTEGDHKDESCFYEKGRQASGIRENSPFNLTFKRIRRDCKTQSENEENENNYYVPMWLDLLETQYLPLASLWTGMMIGDLRRHSDLHHTEQFDTRTRDTNASVESWMNTIKNRLLMKKGPVRIAQFIQKESIILKGRIREYLGEIGKLKTPRKSCNEKESKEHAKEEWLKKNPTRARTAYYYSTPKTEPKPRKNTPKTEPKPRKNTPKTEPKPRKNTQRHVKGNKSEQTLTSDLRLDDSKPGQSGQDSKEENSVIKIPPGLDNTENVCWLNSSIQVFAVMKKLSIQSTDKVSQMTKIVIETIKKGKEPVNEMKGLKMSIANMIGLTIGQQHDASEYVFHILSMEQRRLNVDSILKCHHCHAERVNCDELCLLTIEIPIRQSLTLADCIDEFTKPQLLDGSNKSTCDACGHLTSHLHSQELSGGNSPYMVIMLKRFHQTSHGQRKINRQVFINRLVCIGGMQNPAYYSLVAVQCHIGEELNVGHYITVTLCDNDVICCNDHSVKKMTYEYIQDRMIQKSAFIVYYERIQVHNPFLVLQGTADNEENNIIDAVLKLPPATVMAKSYNLTLLVRDITSLSHNHWLNDQIINMYLKLIVHTFPWVAALDVFFFTSILQDIDATKYIKPEHLRAEKTLIPVLMDNHWSLLVLDGNKHQIKVLDSGSGINVSGMIMRNFLIQNEHLGFPKDWVLHRVKDLPKQDNLDDCGVFLCQNAVNETLDSNSYVKQNKMVNVRKAMMMELLTGRLLIRQ